MVSVSSNSGAPALRRPNAAPSAPPAAEPAADQFTSTREKKIWLVHGSHTGGHKSAAKALKTALEQHPNVDAEVINIAETSTATLSMSTAAEAALKGGAWVNDIRRWVFDLQFEGNDLVKWATNRVMAWEGRSQENFLNRLETEKPDAIISTMSATNSLLSHWKDTGEVEQPVHSVVTDFASHQMWAQDNISYYYAGTPLVKADLAKFGVAENRVSVTGIPIRGDFDGPPQTASEARRELGLGPEKPLVLVLGGSLGYGQFGDTLSAIDDHNGDYQMAAITGRNEKLQQELSGLSTEHTLTVEGFVKNMPTWLEAADLIITKPGGLTCSEILAKGKPMILQRAASGLEKRMVERLEESGAAVVVDSAEEMGQKVSQLFQNPEQLEALSERARELGHPDSSARVAQEILDSLGRQSWPTRVTTFDRVQVHSSLPTES
jgi:processive 1,2-diacylglycerol beta-glucosyltransferase